ncbi:MAG TPA: HEAT repeat domain-containing protein [Planctomycetota bacterium]|nr:HEAT repeat domain-containing protein [Planctomycetota bacterium]
MSAPSGAPPPPDEGRGTPGPGMGEGDNLRAWEVWWELHRDRFISTQARDISISVGLVPPDPRTSVQAENARVGSYERIEPTLRLLLTHEHSDLIVARALIALAKLGEDPRVQGSRTSYATILPYLYNSDAQLSEAAITALGILGTQEAIFPLAQLIEDSASDAASTNRHTGREGDPTRVTDRHRALAFYAIGLIGRSSDREDVRRLAASRICNLFAAESNASAEVRFAALHGLSLVPIGENARRIEDPADRQPRVRPWSERRLARLNAPAPRSIPSASRLGEVDWALAVLDDETEAEWIRAQAVTAAARLCRGVADDSPIRSKVIERLLKALGARSTDSSEVEQSAALALGELGDSDADDLDFRLRSGLAGTVATASDHSTRDFALMSLAMVGSRPGGGASEPGRLAASTDVRRFLLHRAASAKAGELPWNMLALGVFEHEMQRSGVASSADTRAALLDLLVETNSSEQAAAGSLALGLCGATEATGELISRLRDGDSSVRGYAALSLGLLGAREAAPAIERLLNEARQAPELFESASEALARLGAPVSRQLVGLMVGGASLEAQMNLCTALGQVGDGRSLRALSQVACDPSALVWVRAAATSALGTMGTRRPAPWNADLGHALNYLNVPATLSSTALDGLLDLE